MLKYLNSLQCWLCLVGFLTRKVLVFKSNFVILKFTRLQDAFFYLLNCYPLDFQHHQEHYPYYSFAYISLTYSYYSYFIVALVALMVYVYIHHLNYSFVVRVRVPYFDPLYKFLLIKQVLKSNLLILQLDYFVHISRKRQDHLRIQVV